MANSRKIKNASEQYDLRIISTWRFLQICSHVTGAYELRQRNWALRDDADPAPVLPADPAPNDVPMVVNQVPHNVPDAVNPQEAINQNLNVIKYNLLELEHDNIPDNQLFQDPDAVQNIQQRNINLCMTCIEESDQKYIVLPCGHAWVCVVCVTQLQQENTTCPLCRARNVTFQRMFFS